MRMNDAKMKTNTVEYTIGSFLFDIMTRKLKIMHE